ncbi:MULTISPECIES: TetR family transcriptional regulator [unclassified Streptomyces]|uniref:TetR family transcriptional regulator n=1 Tax=unclassified Streptomyces TaxID=2593676 RepID=UPI000AD43A8C|nr:MULTISPECIES: TetR family transcriptional regulator [unclassified Streptomyces]AZM62519.1 TetR family transcriptional regulator [Streptomyces sp. WAC 01438]RSM92508.1 TetR family transcriptional regulator [Streptomyces sp. WAC 01420]
MKTAGAAVGTLPQPNLRERKKQRTRDALVRAALELIASRGYEGTTVDDIAAAVDVSQRTFFRYFASKEDVAFFVPRLAESHVVNAVRARPPGEAPLEALRRAVLDSWDTVNEAVEQLIPLELHLRIHRVIESTPALLAAHLRRATELEEELAGIIAEREGLDVDTDPRPRILVAAVGGVIRVAERRWSAGDDFTVTAMRELMTTCLDHVGPALAGNWRTE